MKFRIELKKYSFNLVDVESSLEFGIDPQIKKLLSRVKKINPSKAFCYFLF